MDTLHTLRRLAANIEKTHEGLGNFLVFNVIAAIAKKCLLNVAVAGIGKSTCTWTLKSLYGDQCKIFDSVTRSGLRYVAEELTNFNGLVIIDDLGKCDTVYSRMATITSLAELSYSHFIRKMTYTVNIEINNFYGASIMNIQPVLMQSIVDKPEWEAVIRDKTIRYYHLIRPLKPVRDTPKIEINIKKTIDSVALKDTDNQSYYNLIAIGLYQWGYARAIEHINDLLKACALIDKRKTVNEEDMLVLLDLMQPLLLERFFFNKFSLEGSISFDKNGMAILTELASFNPLTVAQICADYKITDYRVKEILKTIPIWCFTSNDNKGVVSPTEFASDIIAAILKKDTE